MLKVVHAIDRLTVALAHAVRWLAVAMVVVTMAIVILRYGLEIGAIAMQESVMYMHGILFLIGIPYGLRQGTHVRVDILYARQTPARRRLIDTVGDVIFLLPLAGFIFVSSLPDTAASWRVLQGSSEVGGIPAVFLLKTLIPVTSALMFLQGLAELGKRWLPGGAAA